MSLRALIASDAAALVDATYGFGEPVVCTPENGAAPRTFDAAVLRDPPQQVRGTQKAIAVRALIFVRRHATLGLLSFDKETCTFAFPERVGDASNKTYRVGRIAAQDEGGWKLELT